jgi:uncharacterized protein YecA (UPF0149 family)
MNGEPEANGLKQQVKDHDRRIENMEETMRGVWSKLRCEEHGETLTALRWDIDHTKTDLVARSAAMPIEEWKSMKEQLWSLRFAHWKVGVVVGAVALVAFGIVQALSVSALKRALAREGTQIEESAYPRPKIGGTP